jgi:hypothetical protein
MDPTKRGKKEGASAARYFGSEYQANPGSSRRDYLNDSAWYFGVDDYKKLSPEDREVCDREFAAGIAAERKLQ